MSRKKGFIFSYDAILAIGIVIVMLSGAAFVGYAGKDDGKVHAIMYTNSADNADNNFLLGKSPADTPTKDKANCTHILEYMSSYDVREKVVTCRE